MPKSSASTNHPVFTSIEHEIIVLYAVWDMIGEMVNFDMFEKLASLENTNLMFSTSTHTRLFNVLLVDFLSSPQKDRSRGSLPFGLPPTPKSGRPSDNSYLYYLREICKSPRFDGDTGQLFSAVKSFCDWLDTECLVEKVWLAEISVSANVRASRLSLLKICGNIGKHNFSRLEANVGEIARILASSGAPIDEQQAFLALPSFYEWFHRNFFVYHSSTIAEFLNNLRWAIFRYLQPEFSRSYTRPEPQDIRYSFKYPEDCQQPLARSMYWDLMNNVREEPYFPTFTVTSSLKNQY